jgi:uncharacterized protein
MASNSKALTSVLIKPAGPDCNSSCAYCFYRNKKALFPGKLNCRMSDDLQEEVIRQAMMQSDGEITFAWQGGEPTLMGIPFYERSVDLQRRYGPDRRVGNGLQTNGLLIDDRWARFFRRRMFLIGLSIDGPRDVHDRYRVTADGRGTWPKTVDSAKKMLDHGVAVNAVSVVNDYSAAFPEEIYQHHKALGLCHMQFIPCFERRHEIADSVRSISVSAEAFGRFLCRLFDLWLADFQNGLPTTNIRFFDALFYRYVGRCPPECTLLEACGGYLVVEHNGDVYACDFFVEPAWKLGNLSGATLSALLNSQKQQGFGQMKSLLPDKCRECAWLALCRGGCPHYRISDGDGLPVNGLCRAYQTFFPHAHEPMQKMVDDWLLRCSGGVSCVPEDVFKRAVT